MKLQCVLAVVLLALPAAAAGPARPLSPAALARVRRQEPGRAERALRALRASRATAARAGEELRVRGVRTDALGQTHVRVQQYAGGVRVWGGEAVLHVGADGTVLPPTEALRTLSPVDLQAGVSTEQVLRFVARDLGVQPADVAATTSQELVLVPNPGRPQLAFRRDAATHRWMLDREHSVFNAPASREPTLLAYHVHTSLEDAEQGPRKTDFLVDAHTGLILKKWNSLLTDGPARGVGRTLYSGTVPLDTTDAQSTSGGFELRDTTRPALAHPKTGELGNVTYDFHNNTPRGWFFWPGDIYVDADDTWGDGENFTYDRSEDWTNTDNGQTAAADAHFGLQATWDFYQQVFQRSGVDGLGTSLASRVHLLPHFFNAYWSTEDMCMTYGDGGHMLTSFTPLDIVGHELSHGVMAFSADLAYFDESGGLNEASSDILGTMVEFHVRGDGTGSIPQVGGNWTLGEQMETELYPTPLRWMDLPSRDGLSYDTWFNGVGLDDVHFSSGPGNRMFYLLANGAPASGELATPYVPGGFSGIGNDKAARLWYRAITTYLTSLGDYHAAREACVRAAQDLFGDGSAELAAVENAFGAINVGAAHGQPPRTEVWLQADSFYFDHLYESLGVPSSGLWQWVAAGSTTARPPFAVTVLNAEDKGVTWHAPSGGAVDDSGAFTAPRRVGGILPLEVRSKADPLAHALGLVLPVNLDVDDDTEMDAADLGRVALAYGAGGPDGFAHYDPKADIDMPYTGMPGIDGYDVAAFKDAFRTLYRPE